MFKIFNRNKAPQETDQPVEESKRDEFGLEPTESNDPPSTVITNKIQLALVLLGLVLAIFIAAVDETIVATALGAITREFKAPGEVTWIAGGYLLTMTAFTPLYGKFSDIFGRKAAMLFSLTVFLIGSIFAGAANNIITLIVFRAISGVGAGGLISLSFIIVSDVVPMEKRSMFMSLNNCTFSFANVLGPLLGGVFVDKLSWRWVFYINIPIVIAAGFVVIFLLPLPKPSGGMRVKLRRIDYWGTLTLVSGIILLVLALNWGGKEYAWNSAPVVTCLCLGAVILIIFFFIEVRYAEEPVIPAHVFNRNVILSSINAICQGFVFFVFIYHWPLFYQKVYNVSGTQAGIELLPVILGVCIFAALSGVIVTYTGSYRSIMVIGMCLVVIGNALITRLPEMSRAEQICYPLIVGIGIGLNIQSVIIAAQLAVKEADVAIITAFVTFSLNIGGVLGLAIQGAILNNKVTDLLKDSIPGFQMDSSHGAQDSDSATNPLVTDAFLQAYRVMFLSLIPFSVIGLLSALGLRHIPINRKITVSH